MEALVAKFMQTIIHFAKQNNKHVMVALLWYDHLFDFIVITNSIQRPNYKNIKTRDFCKKSDTHSLCLLLYQGGSGGSR